MFSLTKFQKTTTAHRLVSTFLASQNTLQRAIPLFHTFSTQNVPKRLPEIQSHFKLASLRHSLNSLPPHVTVETFMTHCHAFLFPNAQGKPTQAQQDEIMNILKVWHDGGIVFWCDDANVVWVRADHLRRKLLNNYFGELDVETLMPQQSQKAVQHKELLARLLPLHEQYLRIYARAERRAEHWNWFGAGAVSVQGITMAYMTWWTYGWDVIEPGTYFLGFTVTMASFLFFALLRKDFEYKSMWATLVDFYAHQIQNKEQFPVDDYAALLTEWRLFSDSVKDESLYLYGQITPRLAEHLSLTHHLEHQLRERDAQQ